MKCARFEIAIHEFYRGTLAPDEQAAVEAHAGECRPCGELKRACEELSCRELVRFLNDYLDGELPPGRSAVFDRHLSICPDCRAYLHSYQQTMAWSVAAFASGAGSLPASLPEELIRAVLAARRP